MQIPLDVNFVSAYSIGYGQRTGRGQHTQGTMMNYTVITRDVDGGTTRNYKTLDKAIARFVEMAGQSLESAITESFEFAESIPTIRAVKHVQTVSHYGTVVEFTRHCEPEPEPVAAVPALSDDYDTLAARHEEIGEEIEHIKESDAEAMTQYRSECALYGDAGPGQHPSCWAPQSRAAIAELHAEAAAIGAKMEALRPTPPLPPLSAEETARLAAIPDDIPF
jgi:hypothetical protein